MTKTVRLWQLGHLDKENPSNSLLPSSDGIEKLRKMLEDNVEGSGMVDLIWGPELTVTVVPGDSEEITDKIVTVNGESIEIKGKNLKKDES